MCHGHPQLMARSYFLLEMITVADSASRSTLFAGYCDSLRHTLENHDSWPEESVRNSARLDELTK